MVDLTLLNGSSRFDNGAINVPSGSDDHWEIVCDEIIQGSRGLVAVSSKLGWFISGPVTVRESDSSTSHDHLVLTMQDPYEVGELSDDMGRLEQK